MARGTVSVPVAVALPGVDPSYEPRRGLRLGRYELLHRIAQGGMAEVWSARQTGDFGFSRTCAIKMILPQLAGNAQFRSMFLDEARIVAKIRHPHVVEVIDLGEEGLVVYQAMELVEGDSLAGILRATASKEAPGLWFGMVARIVSDMASGLHAAHELRDDDGVSLELVHRDVSPQNILVSLDGVAKVADFGVAKALGRLAEETEAGQWKGKFSYLSPEQASRTGIDRRSDVFAAGIVLWEALARKRLFRGEDALETISRVMSAPIPSLSTLGPNMPPALCKVTQKALERDPARRYQTAGELSDAIEQAALADKVAISARQLGAAVSACIGDRAIEQRRAISAAAMEITLATTKPTSTTSGSDVRKRVRASELVLGGALVLVTAVLAVYGLRARGPTSPTLAGEPAAAEPLTAAVALPAQTAEGTGRDLDGATSRPTAEPTAPAVVQATAASPRRPGTWLRRGMPSRPTPKPASSAQGLPFGNPY